MKIKLESPFSHDYKSGYVNTNKEPRRVLSLIGNDGSRTSVSYARYLLSVKLNRYLDKKEHADHIDNDKLNDSVSNLQILTSKENNIKKNLHLNIKLKKDIDLICPICGESFSRPSRNIENKLKNGKTPCCSRRCGGINSHKVK